jgi:phosphate/sulfate permease
MSKSAIAIGIILTILGLWISLKIITSDEAPLLVLIYPAIMIGLGIAMIILNKEESKIEQRKDINTKKPKK